MSKTIIEIIINIKNIIQPNMLKNEIENNIKIFIKKSYNDFFEDACCIGIDITKSGTIPDEITFIKKTAHDWNDDIRKNITTKLNEWKACGSPLNSETACELKRAVMNANNTPDPYTNRMLFNMPIPDDKEETDYTFSTIMRDDIIKDIENNPNNYKIITMYTI